MVNYKISVISYLNSIPFVHGLNMSSISKSLILQLDYPSVCADKLINNVVDIGLVPVVILIQLEMEIIRFSFLNTQAFFVKLRVIFWLFL